MLFRFQARTTRHAIVFLSVLTLSTIPLHRATAADSKAITQLQSLTESDQLDQRCDLEGMERLKADKVIAYTFSNPVRSETTVTANGAVFRKKGEWYRLSYACETSKDHMQVVSFDYKIGKIIPHEEWTALYLYP